MADVKIQDLLATTTVADNDLFIVEDNADTKKITSANLRNAIVGNRTYTQQNVVTNGESITNSINELDVDLASHKAENASVGVHGATSSAHGNTIASRDSIGRLFATNRRLLSEGQVITLSSKATSDFIANPEVTLNRRLGSDDGTSEIMLLTVIRATGGNTAVTSMYLVCRQGNGHSITPIVNDTSLTVSITSEHRIRVSAIGTSSIICTLISLGGV